MRIVQLVPSVQTNKTGISAYSSLLAEEMMLRKGIDSHFLTYEDIQSCGSQDFLSLIPEKIEGIVLHCDFRHYRGFFWLFKALELARKNHQFKLILMLHELDATFQKKGLTLPAIRCLFTSYKIFQLADLVITNTSKKKMIASQLLRKSPVVCWLNFSSMGEPEAIPSVMERQPNMIVFGTDRIRRHLYEKFTSELIDACRVLKIKQIYDIGRTCELPLSGFGEIPIVEMGIQPKEVISQLMLTSQAGFLDYSRSPGELGKSSIFAAYCSHGLVPVLTVYNPSEADGIERDKHYLVFAKNSRNLDASQLQQISDNVYSWYQNHTLAKISDFVCSHLLNQSR